MATQMKIAVKDVTETGPSATTKRGSKSTPEKLIKLFRLAARLRQECKKNDLSDNVGAIHSAERALWILGPQIAYPGLLHTTSYRSHPRALFSKKALAAYKRGEPTRIEHVAPHRELTILAIEKIAANAKATLTHRITE